MKLFAGFLPVCLECLKIIDFNYGDAIIYHKVNMRKKCLNNKGLSLVEVVISALIVGVLMAGLYAAYISAKNMTALALHKAVALAWATSKIEGEKNGMQDDYIDPSDNNILANDKGSAVPVPNDTPYGTAMIRHSVTVTWDE